MGLPNPLLKRFRTYNSRNPYIYCARTNRVFRVTEAMNDILDYFGRTSRQDIIKKLEDKHPISSLEQGCDIIEELNKKHGLFQCMEGLDSRVQEFTEEFVAHRLSSGLTSICLEVTSACNFRCKYCAYSGGYEYSRSHEAVHMEWPVAKAAIDLLHKHHHKASEKDFGKYGDSRDDRLHYNIGFYGGEPLLRFDFIKKCVEYANSLTWDKEPDGRTELMFSLTTNGYLLTEEIMDFMIDHNISPVISLDGPKEIHDSNRVSKSGKPTFDKIWENFKTFRTRIDKKKRKNEDYFLGINCVLTPPADLLAVDKFFRDMAREGISTTLTISGVAAGHSTYFRENPEHPERAQHFNTLKKKYVDAVVKGYDLTDPENIFIEQYFGSAYLKIFKRWIGDKVENRLHATPMCFPGKRKPFVTVNGDIHVCERANSSLPIGNVFKGYDIPGIVKKWNQYAELLNMDDCKNCWAFQNCDICFRSILGGGEFLLEKKTGQCQEIRENFLDKLIDYCTILEINPTAFDYMKQYKLI